MDFLVRYIVAAVAFAAVDFVWLSWVANKFYKSQIGNLLLDKPNFPAAIAFYAIFLAGLVLFVINPSIKADDWRVALGLGAAFGLVTYATYDLTNLATLKGYTTKLALVDMAWGTILTASVSLISFFVITRFL
jgi:uncharacterized membrane protein